VLEADIKFVVQIPRPIDAATQMPHKFTLSSDDGTFSQTLPMSEAQAGDVDGTSQLTFTGLAEHLSYTLQCDNGETTYVIFQSQAYDQVQDSSDEGAPEEAPPSSPSSGDNPDDTASA
jgi:hypothetical protein